MFNHERSYFRNVERLSLNSAAAVVPVVQSRVGVSSVADFGCGTGVWLNAWQRCGASAIWGVDRREIPTDLLRIPIEKFTAADLCVPLNLARRFDLVQCLEVAEHLPKESSEQLVSTLTSHSSMVLFSAATPGQGGEGHINEQSLDFWRALFASRGYSLLDPFRPLLVRNAKVAAWYRHNLLLFVEDSRLVSLSSELRACRVEDVAPIPDYVPLPSRLRNRIVAQLPVSLVTVAAVVLRRSSEVVPECMRLLGPKCNSLGRVHSSFGR